MATLFFPRRRRKRRKEKKRGPAYFVPLWLALLQLTRFRSEPPVKRTLSPSPQIPVPRRNPNPAVRNKKKRVFLLPPRTDTRTNAHTHTRGIKTLSVGGPRPQPAKNELTLLWSRRTVPTSCDLRRVMRILTAETNTNTAAGAAGLVLVYARTLAQN